MKINKLGVVFVSLMATLCFVQIAKATVINVTTTADVVDFDSVCSLREAIISANSNADLNDCEDGSEIETDVIVLPAGVYCIEKTAAPENVAQYGDLDIDESVTIEGAGSSETILDAGSSSESVAAGCESPLDERIFHVVEDDSSAFGVVVDSATISLSGLTLRGGYATHAAFNVNAGALYMSTSNSTLNLSDVIFKENTAYAMTGESFGGALSTGDTTSLDFENVVFDGNQSLADADLALAGAVNFGNQNTGTLTNVLVKDNYVAGDTSQPQKGGAFYMGSQVNITITNATFDNNSINATNSISQAGAIYVLAGLDADHPSILTLQSTTFTNNSAGLYGGAIHSAGSFVELTVQNSVFKSNLADNGATCYGTVDAGTHNFADDVTDCTFTEAAPDAADPLLLGLTNEGGISSVQAIDETSPLLDAGYCSGYSVTTDQRGDGFEREIGIACDVGAFELQEHTDVDGDGFFVYAADVTHLDCDDTDDAINHDATEVCDGADNNCDGDTDEATATDVTVWYHDADADGFGDATDSQDACDQPADYVADDSDCDDTDDANNPDATEVCDGVDNNCDGDIDEDFTDLGNSCSVGVGACVDDTGEMVCSDDGSTTVCSGTELASSDEVCDDSLDNDCDGDVDADDTDCAVTDDDGSSGGSGCQLNATESGNQSGWMMLALSTLPLLLVRRKKYQS